MSTAVPITRVAKGSSAVATTAALAASMTIAIADEPAILRIHNADSTHVVTVVASAGTGPAGAGGTFTWTVAGATDEVICLPSSGEVCDANGLIQLAVTVASGGALTSSTASVIAPVS